MTDRELMQEALDALTYVGDKDIYSGTIDALRARLEQPEPLPAKSKGALSHEENKQHNKKILDKFYEENAHLYKAQPEERLFTEAQALDIAQKLFDSAALNAVPIGWVRKKEWVGLTDKEIADCLEMSIQGTCRAIEAKLKEKNSG